MGYELQGGGAIIVLPVLHTPTTGATSEKHAVVQPDSMLAIAPLRLERLYVEILISKNEYGN